MSGVFSVKKYHYNRLKIPAWALVFIVAFFCMETATGVISAQEARPDPTPSANGPDDRIHIVADRLVTDNQSNWAEFIGNVKATQGTTVITSNRLKIYYKQISENRENVIGGEDSIEKIVASGNVVIHFENRNSSGTENL